MKRWRFTYKAQSTLEVITVLMFVLLAMIIFQKYMSRALWGRWKGVGESWSSGRIFDEDKTVECTFNEWGNNGLWYEENCFRENCFGSCVGEESTPGRCDSCLVTHCSTASQVLGIDVCNN